MQIISKESAAAFLISKKRQGFISAKTWNEIKKKWQECKSENDYIQLAKAIYIRIAVANGIYPLSYFN